MKRLLSLAGFFLFCELMLVETPLRQAGQDTCGMTSATTEKIDEASFAVKGKHPASVSDSVGSQGPPHFAGRAQSDYCTNSAGKITAATVTLDGTIDTPGWTDEAATPDKLHIGFGRGGH